MNHAIIFFVSCITFVVMFFVKYPLKRCSKAIAEMITDDEEQGKTVRRRINFIVIVFTCLVSLVTYYEVLNWLGETHAQLRRAIKGAAFAISYYAIYEQWTGGRSVSKENGEEIEGK